MLGLLLRLTILAAALFGLVLLFIYAAVVAVIFTPVILIVLFLLRKKGVIRWATVDLRTAPPGPPRRAPVIDHDPDDQTLR